jgi:hypothetical protein
MKPIKPSEVDAAKKLVIPEFIISELLELVLARNPGYSRATIFKENYFDFEPLFRSEGWDVEYDGPGYNENYKATFTFKKKGQ